MNTLLKSILGLSLVLCLASCASVSFKKTAEEATPHMPAKIYVALFDTTGQWNVDREGSELVAFKTDLQGMLQAGMTTDLTLKLVPAFPTKDLHPKAENAWLIRGAFTRVNQGSRLLRGTIGFGTGGTKVETQVEVYNLNTPSAKPFFTFITTGGSGAEPGAISGLATSPVTMAIQMAASGAGGIAHGLTEDTARTSRQITAVLSDYMYRSGWITKDKWIEPKHLSD